MCIRSSYVIAVFSINCVLSTLHPHKNIEPYGTEHVIPFKMQTSNGKIDFDNRQGGKFFGQLKRGQDEELTAINQTYLEDGTYSDVEDLPEKLIRYKEQFMEFDLDNSGDIDIMELKRMMESLGNAKTHLELKKMIAEVDKTNSGTICYRDFLDMMLGASSSVLKLILLFEEKMKEKEKPTGPPPKRSLDSLP